MGEFLGRMVAYFLLFAVAAAVGAIIRRIRNRADIRGLPQPEERARLLHELRMRRRQGASHSECLQYLRSQGLRTGVAQGMIVDVEREQPPDLTTPRTLQWNQCTCQYPGNWRPKVVDESAGSEAGVSLEGSGSAMLLLVRDEGPSGMEKLLAEYTSQLRDHRISAVTGWGKIQGTGQHLSGVHEKLKLPMDITVFRPGGSSAPFILVEFCAKEESEIMAPAFELIQSTFQLG